MEKSNNYVVQVFKAGAIFLVKEHCRNYGSKYDSVDTEIVWLSQAPEADGTYSYAIEQGRVQVSFESKYNTSDVPQAKVNWAAHGAQDIGHTEGYVAALSLAVLVAKTYESRTDAKTQMTLAEMAKQWDDATVLYDSIQDNTQFECAQEDCDYTVMVNRNAVDLPIHHDSDVVKS